ncbi:ribosomal protein L15 [Thermodesulfobium narugense DSM 14796]|uniref:Large ribosomal subunit protein uL15 n=1 Tax=Thermodesulfobium narugense DSM 14796 TaxID=747365 RepID=M1E4H4_9BACT|nr:ribosomal protein L15 [Thermodesulfobium narugense DSM 14796]
MISLSNLKPSAGAIKEPKRLGRGRSSGHGRTCGRGQAGQNSRSGGGVRPGFEGGQIPIYRRLPKWKGFKNVLFKKIYDVVNVSRLAKLEPGTIVTPEFLEDKGWVKKGALIKILGNGEISIPLTVKAHKFSSSAKEKIEKCGGTVEVLS